MKNRKSIIKWIIIITIFIVLGLLLYFISRFNYNLFHLSTELFTFTVGVLIFTITVISRKYKSYSLMERIGYGMFAVAIMTFLHAISYKGMNIFSGYDSNLPTQLWISLNYILSISILTAIALYKIKIKNWIFITVYSLSAIGLIYLCFAGIFPVCFVEGEGLTFFKIISEYVIIFIYLISFILLFTKKRKEIQDTYKGLTVALLTFIIAEFMFTLYADVYGIQNFLGHYIRLIGLLILFFNIAISNIQEPYSTIFRSLKKSEMILMESEEKYRTLITQMTQGIALHEIILNDEGKAIDYRFLEVNQGFEKLTGLKHEDIVGKTVLEILPGTEQEWIEKYGQVALTGEPLIFEDYSRELGKYYEVVAYSPKHKQFATIFNDITERRQSEGIISHLASFPRLNPDPIIEINQNGSLNYVNPGAKNLFPDLEAVGTHHPYLMDWQTNFAKLSVKGVDTLDREIMVGDCFYSQTLQYIESSNTIRIYGRNITEQKRLEEEKRITDARLNQRQRLESVGTLAGGVAHEINNPINGIMNYGQLILDSLDEESENAEYAKEIVSESNRIAVIVNNLMQFSRNEKQQFTYVNVRDIIESPISLINAVMQNDQIDLQIDIADDLPQLKCKSQQIQQVIMNLLTNAQDALNEKYEGYHADKIIKLNCKQFNKENSKWVRITVEDHGNGIPAAIKRKVFEPFFSSKSRDKGTGLGLYISHGIIKEHHGELTFETKEGQYTKFYIDLPFEND